LTPYFFVHAALRPLASRFLGPRLVNINRVPSRGGFATGNLDATLRSISPDGNMNEVGNILHYRCVAIFIAIESSLVYIETTVVTELAREPWKIVHETWQRPGKQLAIFPLR
jgi:hypothetical protein